MANPDTKETILDAAEKLFAERGFEATSLRQLTAEAGVNLAAVNYHFGSKDDLAKAVLLRYVGPINEERHRRFDVLAEASATPSVAEIVRAFVEPVLVPSRGEGEHSCRANTALPRLFGRITVEQPEFLRGFVQEQFAGLGRRVVEMLQATSPDLDAETLWWRLHFTVGAMAHTLQNAHLLPQISGGVCPTDPHNPQRIVAELVAFAVGGLSAKELA
ncbi:MAG: TetR/AcrR family transcriptional regulator [Planctomycetota bacterium]